MVAKHLRLVNGGALPVAVEVGLWFEGPTISPMTYVNVGADGSFVLSTGFDRDFGPITLFQVSHDFPRGTYAFNCRIVHPVTKKLLAENLNSFDIE